MSIQPEEFTRGPVMVPKDQKVVAIICRDEQGVWQSVPSVETKEGEEVLFLPTARGLVAVLGEICDKDQPTISRLLEGIEMDG
jgi:hypothetical protein